MNLSNHIPTDNLYKFLAISGVIIFILSYVYPRKSLDDYYFQRVKLHGQTEILKPETINLRKNVDLLRNKDKQENEMQEKLINDTFALELKAKELSNINEQISFMVDRYQSYLKFSYFGMAIGYLLSSVGFLLWYFKLQIYQDKIVKKEAKNRT